LPAFIQEQPKEVDNLCTNNEIETPALLVSFLDMKAGFTLTDPNDPRYQKVAAQRLRFGDVCQRAASALRQNTGGEDHIDAVIGVTRAIDTYLLGYGLSRADFDSLQKNYIQAREYVFFYLSPCQNLIPKFIAASVDLGRSRKIIRD
jgi:proteasome activator subunit 4